MCMDFIAIHFRLKSYSNRKKGLSAIDTEMMDLTDFERRLAETQEVIEIRGQVSTFY